MNVVSIGTIPRDLNELNNLNRGQLLRLAAQLQLLNDETNQAIRAMTHQELAQEVLSSLLASDAEGGAPRQMVPPQPVPPQVQPLPQATQAQPGYQQPLAPPSQVGMPPQGPPMPPPVAPPQAPMMRQAPPQMAPQQPYQAPPQMAPPQMAPPQMAPQQPYQAPPQMAPQQPYQAPPQMPQAPQQPYQAPPQYAPQAPPQAAVRQPQSFSDPSNTGASQGVASEAMKHLINILEELNKNVSDIAQTGRGSVVLQRVILKVLLALSEQQGIGTTDMAKLVQLQDDQEVERFVATLGNVRGKS